MARKLVQKSQLEVFENRNMHRKYTIDFECPEFTCLCPRSGFPDFAIIKIKYVPDKLVRRVKIIKALYQ